MHEENDNSRTRKEHDREKELKGTWDSRKWIMEENERQRKEHEA